MNPLHSAQGRGVGSKGFGTDRGSVTVFTTVVCMGLFAFVGLAVDGGEALAAKTQALGQAADAARAGAQALNLADLRHHAVITLDPAAADRAALAYLNTQAAHGTAHANGQQVSVTVTRTVPTLFLGLIGIHALTVTATGAAHAVTTATTVDTP